jgi:membrane protein required for colicin V production
LNYIDIVILAVCTLAFLLGFKDGIIRKIIGTIGFFLALIIAIRFAQFGGKTVHAITSIDPEFAEVLGGFLIFILIIVLTSVVKRLVHPHDKVNNLLNKIIGGVAGVLQVLVFLSAVFYLTGKFNFPSKTVQDKSLTYSIVQGVLPKAIDWLSTVKPKAPVLPAVKQDKDSI